MAKFGESSEVVKCSFCGKSPKEVVRLIAGTGVYICDECVTLCVEIIDEELADGASGADVLGSDGVKSGPRRPTRVFPEVPSLPEVPTEHRVQLYYDKRDERLIGTLSDQPVEWQLVRHRRVSGLIGAVVLEGSWTTGDNYVPEPGGWIPRPDFVSDFPNIPAGLSGSFGGLEAELHGVFHLDPGYAFQRGSVVGRIGAVHMEATVVEASGGLSDFGTVAVEGTYGSVSFELYATIDGGLSQGLLHGSVAGAPLHLDLGSSSVPRSVALGSAPFDLPGPHVDISGSYDGPPELLALMVGAMLEFL
jgi:hypothetical protein